MPANELSPAGDGERKPALQVRILLSIQPLTNFPAIPFNGAFGTCQTFENLKLRHILQDRP